MSQGKSVKLFLVDGSVGGPRTAEIMNWTGHALAGSRTDLPELLKREESQRTGVYVLIGDGQAYIGESDFVGRRLRDHAQPERRDGSDRGKDFWNEVILLTNKDANLTKAHARYLESRFITLAREAGRMALVNSATPGPPLLPEADRSDMEFFISQAKIILPVLGVNLLRGRPISTAQGAFPEESVSTNDSSPIFVLQVPGGGTARAQEIDGEFTVLAESNARAKWASGPKDGHKTRRQQYHQALIDSGVLRPTEDGALVAQKNIVFSSPSAASAILKGNDTSNGRTAWLIEGSKQTYSDWQASNLEQL